MLSTPGGVAAFLAVIMRFNHQYSGFGSHSYSNTLNKFGTELSCRPVLNPDGF